MSFWKDKKKIIIIVVVIILVIILAIILKNKKKDAKIQLINKIVKYDLNIEGVRTMELQAEEKIQTIFSKIQEQYQENKKINSKDKIENYYNNIRLELENEELNLSFVNIEDIPTTELNLHDLEGKMVTEVPIPTMDGKKVEISSSSNTISGKYYILRVYVYPDSYTFYYVITFDNIGLIKINWLCFSMFL